jgi:hypothetical protein
MFEGIEADPRTALGPGNEYYAGIAKDLYQARLRLHLTINEASRLIGVSTATVDNFEHCLNCTTDVLARVVVWLSTLEPPTENDVS